LKKKLLILGFDGISWEYMNYLIEREHLPNFSKLKDYSSYGPLTSTYPPGSYIAWPSFMTGVNPGKHSIFYPLIFQKEWSYEGKAVNCTHIKCPTMYEIFSKKGLTVGVINQPAAYPPFKVNGFIVANGPSNHSEFTCPSSLKDDLLNKFPDYAIGVKKESDGRKTVENAIKVMETRKNVAEHYFIKYDPDVKCIIFTVTDSISHWYWNKPELIDRLYQHCDAILKSFFNQYHETHDMVVLSDHGFGRCVSMFYPNRWLAHLGLLQWNKVRIDYSRLLKTKSKKIIKKLLVNLGLFDKYVKRQDTTHIIEKRMNELSSQIDWRNTKLCFREDMGFRFNILGREQKGIITPNEALELYKELAVKIKDLRDPHNFNISPFYGFIKSTDIYNGQFTKFSPDFYIDVKHNYDRAFSSAYNDKLFGKNVLNPGKHSSKGILFALGNDINESKQIKDMKLIDVLPNLLYLMGLEGYSYFDGIIKKEMFKRDFLNSNVFKIKEDETKRERESIDLNGNETKMFEEFWKQVGYL